MADFCTLEDLCLKDNIPIALFSETTLIEESCDINDDFTTSQDIDGVTILSKEGLISCFEPVHRAVRFRKKFHGMWKPNNYYKGLNLPIGNVWTFPVFNVSELEVNVLVIPDDPDTMSMEFLHEVWNEFMFNIVSTACRSLEDTSSSRREYTGNIANGCTIYG